MSDKRPPEAGEWRLRYTNHWDIVSIDGSLIIGNFDDRREIQVVVAAHNAALRAATERAEKMRPVYEAACRYMSDPSPATKEALLRAWRSDAALRGKDE